VISGRLISLARLGMIALLLIGTMGHIHDHIYKWYGYFSRKWLFAQGHKDGMLSRENGAKALSLSFVAVYTIHRPRFDGAWFKRNV
jgi:hypothetical protein